MTRLILCAALLSGSVVVSAAALGDKSAADPPAVDAAPVSASTVDRAWLLAQPVGADLGGTTTRPVEGPRAFTFMIDNAGRDRQRPFFFGNRLFNTNWTQAPSSVKSFDGLGPLFNRTSCSGCHTFDGRGRPPAEPGAPFDSMLVRISLPGASPHGGPKPVPAYGDQISDRGLPGVPPEARPVIEYEEVAGTYPDGAGYSLRRPTYRLLDPAYGPLPADLLLSPRVAPQVIGLGLLEAVPEAQILALADPEDADGDGISGRANRVWDAVAGRGGALGRFGWKANQPSLRQQNADAAFGDIGLTSALHPAENCTTAQPECLAAARGDTPDLGDSFLDRLTLYTRILAVPRRSRAAEPIVQRGEMVFREAGCASCHMPTLVTGAVPDVPELAGQTIHPFTDLLLHDMGEALADGRPDFLADGREWRTPPLWGLGRIATVNGHTDLLHDGRARSAEEAVLWHGGEARAARDAFMARPPDDRAALIAFLNSL